MIREAWLGPTGSKPTPRATRTLNALRHKLTKYGFREEASILIKILS
jgi:hypothetical protein